MKTIFENYPVQITIDSIIFDEDIGTLILNTIKIIISFD